jgi:hypothetical protein
MSKKKQEDKRKDNPKATQVPSSGKPRETALTDQELDRVVGGAARTGGLE